MNSVSSCEKDKLRHHSSANIIERNNNRKLLVINKLEDVLKNCTMHQSIKALEKIKEEKRKRELVTLLCKVS